MDANVRRPRLAVTTSKSNAYCWCHFQEYGKQELAGILAAVHPHLSASASASASELAAQVEYLHKLFGVVVGNIRPFLNQVDARLDALGGRITLPVLEAVRKVLVGDQNRILEDESRGYRRSEPAPDPSTDGSPPKGKRRRSGPAGGRKRPPKKRSNRPPADGASPAADDPTPDASSDGQPGPEDGHGGAPA